MGILKLASEATDKLDLGEGDFLEVRAGVSKREFRSLLETLPDNWDNMTPAQADEFSTQLFKLLVRGWSLDVEANEENYQLLESNAASSVDSALIKHFNGLTPSAEEKSKSKGDK